MSTQRTVFGPWEGNPNAPRGSLQYNLWRDGQFDMRGNPHQPGNVALTPDLARRHRYGDIVTYNGVTGRFVDVTNSRLSNRIDVWTPDRNAANALDPDIRTSSGAPDPPRNRTAAIRGGAGFRPRPIDASGSAGYVRPPVRGGAAATLPPALAASGEAGLRGNRSAAGGADGTNMPAIASVEAGATGGRGRNPAISGGAGTELPQQPGLVASAESSMPTWGAIVGNYLGQAGGFAAGGGAEAGGFRGGTTYNTGGSAPDPTGVAHVPGRWTPDATFGQVYEIEQAPAETMRGGSTQDTALATGTEGAGAIAGGGGGNGGAVATQTPAVVRGGAGAGGYVSTGRTQGQIDAIMQQHTQNIVASGFGSMAGIGQRERHTGDFSNSIGSNSTGVNSTDSLDRALSQPDELTLGSRRVLPRALQGASGRGIATRQLYANEAARMQSLGYGNWTVAGSIRNPSVANARTGGARPVRGFGSTSAGRAPAGAGGGAT